MSNSYSISSSFMVPSAPQVQNGPQVSNGFFSVRNQQNVSSQFGSSQNVSNQNVSNGFGNGSSMFPNSNGVSPCMSVPQQGLNGNSVECPKVIMENVHSPQTHSPTHSVGQKSVYNHVQMNSSVLMPEPVQMKPVETPPNQIPQMQNHQIPFLSKSVNGEIPYNRPPNCDSHLQELFMMQQTMLENMQKQMVQMQNQIQKPYMNNQNAPVSTQSAPISVKNLSVQTAFIQPGNNPLGASSLQDNANSSKKTKSNSDSHSSDDLLVSSSSSSEDSDVSIYNNPEIFARMYMNILMEECSHNARYYEWKIVMTVKPKNGGKTIKQKTVYCKSHPLPEDEPTKLKFTTVHPKYDIKFKFNRVF